MLNIINLPIYSIGKFDLKWYSGILSVLTLKCAHACEIYWGKKVIKFTGIGIQAKGYHEVT